MGNLASLIGEVKQKVHTLIMVGDCVTEIKKTFAGLANLIQASDLEEAVRTAYFFANEPDVVIYSPASGNEENVEINGSRFLNFVNDL
jgi:UDP-N-acetylmuramoylalanine-D-glutamate ligase